MNKQEQLLIKSVVDSLHKSLITDWTTAGFEEWHEFAVRMKHVIGTSINTLNVLVKDEFQTEVIPKAIDTAKSLPNLEAAIKMQKDILERQSQKDSIIKKEPDKSWN